MIIPDQSSRYAKRPTEALNVQIKCSGASTDKIRELSRATQLSANRIGNILVEFALKHVRLKPTTITTYDIQFWTGTTAPSRANALQFFPQLADLTSGLGTQQS